jgi:hypothetical protein
VLTCPSGRQCTPNSSGSPDKSGHHSPLHSSLVVHTPGGHFAVLSPINEGGAESSGTGVRLCYIVTEIHSCGSLVPRPSSLTPPPTPTHTHTHTHTKLSKREAWVNLSHDLRHSVERR